MKRIVSVLAAVLLLLGEHTAPAAHAAGATDSRFGPPLEYHGGPIVTNAKNYLVFWTGGNRKAFDPKYVSVLQQWQKDARHITVFKATTQYTQADWKHPTDTTYAGTYYNHTPFPKHPECQSACVLNADITRIAAATVKANKIPAGLGHIVYVYTPQGVRRCWYLDPGGSTADRTPCEDEQDTIDYRGRCGARSNVPVGNKQFHLVIVDYPSHPGCHRSDGTQRFPNGMAVDAAVNVTAHFQMAVITNPYESAWYVRPDDYNIETSSQCMYSFGPRLPGRPGNSHYNGRTYDVHAMGSNKDRGCVVGSRTDGF